MHLENTPLSSLLAITGDALLPALEETAPQWEALRQVLDGQAGTPTEEADGAASEHAHGAREEAARKLITNHAAVVRDVTNPAPKSQQQLARVSTPAAPYVDQMLREVARRLLGRQPALQQMEETLDASVPVQAEAWAGTARYLRNRTQATPEERPGRKPDMSEAAVAAFRAVLEEVGGVAVSLQWVALGKLLDGATGLTEADGAASEHAHGAREEAVRKLITNHAAVVRDVTNPAPKSQPQLVRVSEAVAPYVDQTLREVARRLLGRRPGAQQLQEHVDTVTASQTARFLHNRIQSTAEEKPGRHPDMSTAAAAAMRAVLAEVGGVETCPKWEALRQLMDGSQLAEGVGGAYEHGAREAARKLITNHAAVVRDVTNPAPKSQQQLARVSEAAAPYVDQMLREVARRLLGPQAGSAQLEETLDASVPAQAAAWVSTFNFLIGRIQSTAEMVGRTPDMSMIAAAALRAVLKEVAEGKPAGAPMNVAAMADFVNAAVGEALAVTGPQWEALRQVLDGQAGTPTEEADGAASEHAHGAREEAARKLITNHAAVVRDVTNPAPKSQQQLARVSTPAAPYVDQMLREVARRLLGRQPALQQMEETLDASVPVQAEAWAGTARYLRNRTQATPDHNPGRKPDMSEAAAAAFRAVLEEVGGVAVSPLEELLLAGVQGRASITKCVEIAWKGGGVDRMEVRITPLYDTQRGSMQHLLIGLFAEHSTMLTQGLGVAKLPGSEASSEDMNFSARSEEMEVTECSTPSEPVEGLRNVSGAAQNLLQAADAATTAWAVVFASVLQKSMFKTVLLTRPKAGASSGADGAATPGPEEPYEIWHASQGLEEMLGLEKGALLGCDCTGLSASASVPEPQSHDAQELHRAVASRTGSLIETVLTTSSGSPLFCLAYVMPLHCHGARAGTTAVAFLDVHRSLPYMQKQMESRDIADCDLYTFVKFSLLNCLVTDPSSPTPSPAQRNPIVFASAGFSAMSGAITEECLGRNCRFLQQKYMGLRGREGEAPAQTAEQLEAIAHMAAALDSRQESLTLLTNFRVDGSRFANLLFMTPVVQEGPSDGGVLFWVGVQHPVDEAMVERVSTASMALSTASVNSANHTRLLRSCQQSLQSLQLQELYSEYTTNVHRRSIAIHSADNGCATCVCRLCEHPVLAEQMAIHTPMCKVVSQCRSIVEHADGTLARVLCKLNAATSSAFISGSYGSQSGQVVELLRTFTAALLGVTASSQVLAQLAALPAKLEELIAGPQLNPATALCWIDIKAAGQRKLAALQHAVLWTSDLVQTIVPRADDDPLSHGQAPCLQDFEVVRELQRGSHAAVYMVRKVQTGDVFAMKVLDTQRAKSYRLATERKILLSVNSPFVIRTFFAFEDASRLFLVMECMHSDVKNLLQKVGVIPESQAVSLMADLVLALEHMHGCGVYHRDLKPENLLLTGEGRLKLADFGLSHVVAPKTSPLKDPLLNNAASPPEDDTARDPSIVGTPFYMAPEVIQGRARGIEVASEWWSCGVIMYEFLTGFPPFQGRKVAEIYRAILKLAFVVDIRRCNVSAEAADLVQRLLVVEPRARLVDAPRVKAHPFFRGVNWPSHAQPVAAAKNPAVPTAQGLAAQNVSYSAKDATLADSEGTATTARASDAGAPAGGGAAAGSKSNDSKSSKSSGGVLSAASTQDFHAQLQLQLGSEKNDAHLDNLTGLNDMVGAAESWAPPRKAAAAVDGVQLHGEGPQEEKKARTT